MKEPKPLSLHLPADLEPQFVNFVRVAHTAGEFVLDFSTILPGIEEPNVEARIIVSPLGAKLLEQALSGNIQRFESTFGEIRVPLSHSLADDLFSSPGNTPPEGV